MSARIAVVLPRKETFARDRFGAIALVVEAYVGHSAFRGDTDVLGMAVAQPREAARFRAVTPRDRWWRRRNRGFALGVADDLAAAPPRFIDVHNRVAVFALLAARFPDAAVSLWLHNDPQGMRGARTPAERRGILGRARFVICVSEWVRGRFLDGVTDGAERVIVLPATFDTVTVTPAPKEKSILYVGRIIPDKGVLPLAEALARTLPNLAGWRATLIGDGRKPGDAYRGRVAAALAPLGERVTMPGFVDHETAMTAFARAAIAIVPSVWQEPFGRTAIEAMAAGCAVIASRRGGLPEVVGDSGILLDTPDAPSLAAAIADLARNDTARTDLQRRSRTRAVEALDIRPWAARLDAMRRAVDPTLQ